MADLSKNNMIAVVFAGGVGTRMWPLSRVQTPKQFEKMVNNKSTLQLAIERLRPEFDWQNIYISTGQKYASLVKKQLPQIPQANIIGEPEMRDVAGAVGYLSAIIAKKNANSPIAILWSDHIMKKVDTFRKSLQIGGEFLNSHQDKILFIGQKARFANPNLGWIQMGSQLTKIDGFKLYKFKSWDYRPNIQLAKQYFSKKNYTWNTGYFIATPKFILEQYKKFQPEMYDKLMQLQSSYGSPDHQKELQKIYPTFKKISFDDAILVKLESNKGVVLSVDFKWSDIGNWQALKEALQKNIKGNVTYGEVYPYQCEDTLIYNYSKQLATAIDLKNIVVVNTEDVLLVCTKESMKNIKEVVGQFKKKKAYKKFT